MIAVARAPHIERNIMRFSYPHALPLRGIKHD